jgi:cytochrome c oxidase subunit 2
MRLQRFSPPGLRAALAAALLSWIASPMAAFAQPENWKVGFQRSVTPIADEMHGFHNLLLVIIALIVVFVLVLLVLVVVRFNAKANPSPSRNSHNTLLEVAWTILPVLILLVIAIPSFRLLYAQYDFPKPDLTIKATGHQWYWSYNYPDNGGFNYDSLMLEDKDRKPDQPRLLAVDNEAVVPVGKVVHVLITADDVIHNWTVPAFGVKIDAVPGRVTRVWFQARETGMYYGQCSELCGERHAFMPIAVRVVTEQEFASWVDNAKKKFAENGTASPGSAAQAGQRAAGDAALKLAAAEQH